MKWERVKRERNFNHIGFQANKISKSNQKSRSGLVSNNFRSRTVAVHLRSHSVDRFQKANVKLYLPSEQKKKPNRLNHQRNDKRLKLIYIAWCFTYEFEQHSDIYHRLWWISQYLSHLNASTSHRKQIFFIHSQSNLMRTFLLIFFKSHKPFGVQ